MKLAEASDQPKMRRTVIVPDQHGRPWEVTIDKESFVHCTIPIPRFRAPLMPPPQFVTSNPERPGRVRIDYRAWEAERVEANREWAARKVELSRQEKDADLVAAILGARPESAEFVRAARLGESPWILGQPAADGAQRPVPEWALGVGLDRLMPRQSRAVDVRAERAALKGRYRDDDAGPLSAADVAHIDDDADTPNEDGWMTRLNAIGADADDDDGDMDDLEEDAADDAGEPTDDLEDDIQDDLEEPEGPPPVPAPVPLRRKRGGRTAPAEG